LNSPTAILASLSSLSLDELAAQIGRTYTHATIEAGQAALKIGLLLLEAQLKVEVSGLKWGEWVQAHLPFSPRQAGSYLKFARDARLNQKRASDITATDLDNLLRLLASSAPERDPDQPAPALNVVQLQRSGASEAKPELDIAQAPGPEPSAAPSSDLRHPGAVIGALKAFNKLNLDQRRRYLTQLLRKLSPHQRQCLVEELAKLN
jgi:hypothetical protein